MGRSPDIHGSKLEKQHTFIDDQHYLGRRIGSLSARLQCNEVAAPFISEMNRLDLRLSVAGEADAGPGRPLEQIKRLLQRNSNRHLSRHAHTSVAGANDDPAIRLTAVSQRLTTVRLQQSQPFRIAARTIENHPVVLSQG